MSAEDILKTSWKYPQVVSSEVDFKEEPPLKVFFYVKKNELNFYTLSLLQQLLQKIWSLLNFQRIKASVDVVVSTY